MAQQKESSEVFLFVNPGSGGGIGKVFLEDGVPTAIPLDDGSIKTLKESLEINLVSMHLRRPPGAVWCESLLVEAMAV